jgi:hypothetical protein
VSGDTVWIENSSQSITSGLAQSAVHLAALNIGQSYTGSLGSATAFLQIGVTGAGTVNIGYATPAGSSAGSGRIKLNLGTTTAAITVSNSASSATDTGYTPIQLKNVQASSTLNVLKGIVGVAVGRGEVSTLGTVYSQYTTSQSSDATVVLGSGVTWTTLNQSGGTVTINSAGTTINQYGGTLYVQGGGAYTTITQTGGTQWLYDTGAITTLTVDGGTCYGNKTGTITTLACKSGTVDLTKGITARTVTTPQIWKGAVLKYDPAIVTMTNKVAPQEALTLTAS